MLRVVENLKPPLVIARPTELIEKLLPRFDSSCKKLIEEKTDEKEIAGFGM
jgi:hypothetical protein